MSGTNRKPYPSCLTIRQYTSKVGEPLTKIVNVALYFSKLEWALVEEMHIDIVDLCRVSIKKEIESGIQIKQMFRGQDLYEENKKLREELELLRKGIMGNDGGATTGARRTRARIIPPDHHAK